MIAVCFCFVLCFALFLCVGVLWSASCNSLHFTSSHPFAFADCNDVCCAAAGEQEKCFWLMVGWVGFFSVTLWLKRGNAEQVSAENNLSTLSLAEQHV